MNKIRIGLPRTIFYFNEGKFLKYFLETLDFEVVLSKETDEEIINLGECFKEKEMCIPLKIFLGHLLYLKDKCDYILNIKFISSSDSLYGCPNYSLAQELLKEKTDIKILNINIDHYNYKTLYKELLSIFNEFSIDKKRIKEAYLSSKIRIAKEKKKEVVKNTNKMYIDRLKVLLIGHEYILYDNYLSGRVIKYLNNYNVEIIYSSLFDKEKVKEISKLYIRDFNIKGVRKKIGALMYSRNYINGIVFLSTGCMEDNLLYEYINRRIGLPLINIELDKLDNIEKDLESFIFLLDK